MKQLVILVKVLFLKIIHPSYIVLCVDTKYGIFDDVEIIKSVDYNGQTHKAIIVKIPTLMK